MIETLRRMLPAGSGNFMLTLVAALGAAALVVMALTVLAPAQAQTRFVFANPSTYDTLDPHLVMDTGRSASRINLYDGLLRWQDNPAKLELWLAETYSISEDGWTYTFNLRKGAKFHDGTEIKAADIVYSIERILALKQGASTLFASLLAPGSTKVTSDYAVEFNLIKPSAIFLAVLPELHVVNTALVKKNEINNDWGSAWLAKNDAGSGSYRLQLYNPVTGFIAERFKEHWNPKWGGKPIDEIEFRTVSEASIRMKGLTTGDFQGTDGYLPAEQIKRLREAPNIYVLEADSMRIFYAILHNGREPLAEIDFRKALSFAFDYDGFNKGILGETAVSRVR